MIIFMVASVLFSNPTFKVGNIALQKTHVFVVLGFGFLPLPKTGILRLLRLAGALLICLAVCAREIAITITLELPPPL